MKIVILDQITLGNDLDFSKLRALGDLTVHAVCPTEDMPRLLADADISISNKPRYDAKSLANADHLKLICLTATGYDNCDLAFLRQRGIALCNIAGYSTDSVAQHVFAMLFHYMERIHEFEPLVRTRSYVNADLYGMVDTRFFELRGKTWGIVGLGRIGRRVAELAEAFGCRVLYYSTSGTHEDEKVCRVSLEELLQSSDILSIHAPLNENTRNLITKKELRKMKASSCLINTGRGGIINEADLAEAIREKIIGGACIDVFAEEPIAADSPYLKLSDYRNLILTPHIAWSAVESRQRAINECAENIRAFQQGQRRNRIV